MKQLLKCASSLNKDVGKTIKFDPRSAVLIMSSEAILVRYLNAAQQFVTLREGISLLSGKII